MAQKKLNSTQTTYQRNVEAALRNSCILPEMSYRKATSYYKSLERQATQLSENMDVITSQYIELSRIFGIRPNVNKILKARYDSQTTVVCGFSNLCEYKNLLLDTLKDNVASEVEEAVRSQLAVVDFCTELV